MMLAESGSAHIRCAAVVFVTALVCTACGDSLTGPVDRNHVSPAPSVAPAPGQTTGCQGGSAAGFPCNGVDLVARVTAAALRPGRPTTHVNDVWGWTDPQTGVEYALVGRDDGLSIVDLRTPRAPRPIAFLPSHAGSSTWRDVKVYRDHAYVVADHIAGHGMQILDLTRLRGLTAFTELGADARYTRLSAVHNLAINEETGFAYAVGSHLGGDTCGGGLHMIDLSNPRRPSFAGCHAVAGTGRQGRGYTHDVQCVVYRGPDAAHLGHEICVGANETAIAVSDVTDKANPQTISTGAYADYGYVHQGWLSEDHRYFYQNDELDELDGRVSRTRMLVWDLADLEDPVLVREHHGPTGAIDHNLYVRENVIYHSNYAFGVRILDISDPASPVERGFFDTVAGRNDGAWVGSWSTYPWFGSGIFVATSWDEGLFLLRLQ